MSSANVNDHSTVCSSTSGSFAYKEYTLTISADVNITKAQQLTLSVERPLFLHHQHLNEPVKQLAKNLKIRKRGYRDQVPTTVMEKRMGQVQFLSTGLLISKLRGDLGEEN